MSHWENTTRVVPPICVQSKPSLVHFLYKLGKKNEELKNGESMIIIYSRDIKQMVKCRFSGGLYESLEKIQEDDHDIIVVDQRRGLLLVKVYYSNEKQRGETDDRRFLPVKQRCESAMRDLTKLKGLMGIAGALKKKQVDECFSIHFPIVAFPGVHKGKKQPEKFLILYEEELCSEDKFQIWWNERVRNLKVTMDFTMKPEVHLTLLAMFVAPLYSSPALESGETQFLAEKDLAFLVNKPTKCVINGGSEAENRNLLQEKTRNISTKWFSRRKEIQQERILVIGPNAISFVDRKAHKWDNEAGGDSWEDNNAEQYVPKIEVPKTKESTDQECHIENNFRNGMEDPENQSEEYSPLNPFLMRQMMMRKSRVWRLEYDIKTRLRSGGEFLNAEERTQLNEFLRLSRDMKLLHFFIVDFFNSKHVDNLRAAGSRMKTEQNQNERNDENEGKELKEELLGLSLMEQLTTLFEEMQMRASLGLAVSHCDVERSSEESRDATKEAMSPPCGLQKIQKDGKKFDYIFVLGVNELCRNHNDQCLKNLRDLHLSHADGHFWLFSSEDRIEGHLYAQLSAENSRKVGGKTIKSEPAKESTWLDQAQEHIKRSYCHWETEQITRLVPPIQRIDDWVNEAKTKGEKAERKLILDLYHFGQENKMAMFITYNRKFFHLIESRNEGGGIEDILTGKHDIMLIHRDLGAIFIQVKNINKMRALQEDINKAKEQVKNDVLSLEVTRQNLMKDMKESSSEVISVSLCVIALPNVKKAQVERRPLEDLPVPTVFICEDDLMTNESLKKWWEENILHKLRNSPIDSKTYLKLLAIYIAPVYVTPAFKARMTTQELNFLTEDKLDLLVNGPKDMILKGAAGTGKTWLLQEKIRNIFMSWFSNGPIPDRDEKILVVCHQELLAEHFCETLPDLLLTSAMAALKRWIQKGQEETEKKTVRNIIRDNLMICCLSNGSETARKGNSANEKVATGEDKPGENEELRFEKLTKRMRCASWETFIFYNILKSSVASLWPDYKVGRWPLKAVIIRRLFQSFTPSMGAFRFLEASIKEMTFKAGNIYQLLHEGCTTRSIAGIFLRLSECWLLFPELPETVKNVALKDMDKILKTRKPPFRHIFVDEAEDLRREYGDHWRTSLRSLQDGTGGYFWQAYDPLCLPFIPDFLKMELEEAHSLLTVYRNPVSVFNVWNSDNLSSEIDYELNSPELDPNYKRENIQSGHDLRGPEVEKFDVPSSLLSVKIVEIMREKFGLETQSGDIAVIFAEKGDFLVHGERLRNELTEKLRASTDCASVIVENATAFKGMEAPIVFLITSEKPKRRGNIYLGASRSTSCLIRLDMEPSDEDDEAAERELMEISRRGLPNDVSEEYKEDCEKEFRRHKFIQISQKART
ncbi:unnamed protein product [Darwinula stevensoni]|uniref:Uncharacterized protein n=1 Tax=Darwinula stevensoni TaxID=69355 RepID=A0A7R8XCC2_9CRUS|nr:unnamed protein product [Darwinula stevensoni]CAG0893629.1 unnamed protein product [Darwinula stevensoni]